MLRGSKRVDLLEKNLGVKNAGASTSFLWRLEQERREKRALQWTALRFIPCCAELTPPPLPPAPNLAGLPSAPPTVHAVVHHRCPLPSMQSSGKPEVPTPSTTTYAPWSQFLRRHPPALFICCAVCLLLNSLDGFCDITL